MASLDSVNCKLFRAKEYYGAFLTAAERHFQGYPRTLVAEFNHATNTIAHDFVADAPLPLQLPLILGDCLQNARDSLDYLVGELVIAAKAEPTDRHSFPICQTAKAFKECKRARFNGLSEEVVAQIELLQPYHDGQDFRLQCFWILDKLCNINKHRRILLTRLKAGMAGRPIGSDKYAIIPPGATEVHMDTQLVAYIAFEEKGLVDGADACSIVKQLIDSVERVLPNFNRFLN
jgi:hypothetical protein